MTQTSWFPRCIHVFLIGALSIFVACSSASVDDADAGMSAMGNSSTMFAADAYMRPNVTTQPSSNLDMSAPGPVNSSDASMDRPDRFIPSAQPMNTPDAVVASATEKLEECIQEMVGIVKNVYTSDNCEMYTDSDKDDPSSGYNQTLGTPVCIKMECANDVPSLETHNGIITRRKCAWLDDLVKVLEGGRDDALDGNCQEPRSQIRVIPLDQWTGDEMCDQYVCGLDGQGNPIIGVND